MNQSSEITFEPSLHEKILALTLDAMTEQAMKGTCCTKEEMVFLKETQVSLLHVALWESQVSRMAEEADGAVGLFLTALGYVLSSYVRRIKEQIPNIKANQEHFRDAHVAAFGNKETFGRICELYILWYQGIAGIENPETYVDQARTEVTRQVND